MLLQEFRKEFVKLLVTLDTSIYQIKSVLIGNEDECESNKCESVEENEKQPNLVYFLNCASGLRVKIQRNFEAVYNAVVNPKPETCCDEKPVLPLLQEKTNEWLVYLSDFSDHLDYFIVDLCGIDYPEAESEIKKPTLSISDNLDQIIELAEECKEKVSRILNFITNEGTKVNEK